MCARHFRPGSRSSSAWLASVQVRPESRPAADPFRRRAESCVAILEATNVEALWLAHEHVNWETGEPDKDADYEGPGRATHCSAFAAAVGKRLGVYMLRPPEHGQILLANAQAAWFHSAAGQQNGWRPLKTATEAQTLANEGQLVTVVYENPDSHRPGHIAIVRPAARPSVSSTRTAPRSRRLARGTI